MGCVFREWDHECENGCPHCCPEWGEEMSAELETALAASLDEAAAPYRERALRAEALLREKDETIGELLALMPHVVDVRHVEWPAR